MIRNPSDGSVKQKSAPIFRTSHNDGEHLPNSDVAEVGAGSGLPQPKINAEELARLENSREWLKNRRESK